MLDGSKLLCVTKPACIKLMIMHNYNFLLGLFCQLHSLGTNNHATNYNSYQAFVNTD